MRTQTPSVLAAAWLLLALYTAGGITDATAATQKKKANTHAPASASLPPTTHVFRCGDQYQSAPCQTLDASSRIVPVKDTRTEEQIRAAFQARKQAAADMRVIEKAQSKRARRSSKTSNVAIGLSCHRPGARPFEPCDGTDKHPGSSAASKHRKSQKPQKPKTDRYLAVSPDVS